LLAHLQLKVRGAIVNHEDALQRVHQALAAAIQVIDIAHIAPTPVGERDHDAGLLQGLRQPKGFGLPADCVNEGA
jgi:hypothetical protein